MSRFSFLLLITFLSISEQNIFAQYKMNFGNLTKAELSNSVYKPDPGADAIVLSDVGIAKLNYIDDFYVELERDVRIRIVNNNGFNYTDIELPFSKEDDLINYRASSFNLKNGDIVETKINKKGFILETTTDYQKTLKFSFPDVHEGTIVEYSYIIRFKGESVYSLVNWPFQTSIPEVISSLTVAYPDYFTYKSNITGNSDLVKTQVKELEQMYLGNRARVLNCTWTAQNVPAFTKEPFIKSKEDNLTQVQFELASVNIPDISSKEITPTYSTLTEKLLTRDDFGVALNNTTFLKKTANEVTKGLNDDLLKLKAIHKYVSEKILWNGEEDFLASSSLKKVFNKEKGNCADINMILIGMLRCVNIKAEPVILCTRSNGSINDYYAMMRQFNYMVAFVPIDKNIYLVDATNPIRKFDILPFSCLNGSGRLISESNSRFIELKNSEKYSQFTNIDLTISSDGSLEGEFCRKSSGFTALDIRNQVRIEGEDGYRQIIKYEMPDVDIHDFVIRNLANRDSDIIETASVKINEELITAGNRILINPFFQFIKNDNPFKIPERFSPVDFGCPTEDNVSIAIHIPKQYEVIDVPEDITFSLGSNEAEYKFNIQKRENTLLVTGKLEINKTTFPVTDYPKLKDFYAQMLNSQNRLIVLKRIN